MVADRQAINSLRFRLAIEKDLFLLPYLVFVYLQRSYILFIFCLFPLQECQAEPMVIYADRLRKFYRNLGEAVSRIVGDDFKAKRRSMSTQNTAAPGAPKMLKIANE